MRTQCIYRCRLILRINNDYFRGASTSDDCVIACNTAQIKISLKYINYKTTFIQCIYFSWILWMPFCILKAQSICIGLYIVWNIIHIFVSNSIPGYFLYKEIDRISIVFTYPSYETRAASATPSRVATRISRMVKQLETAVQLSFIQNNSSWRLICNTWYYWTDFYLWQEKFPRC